MKQNDKQKQANLLQSISNDNAFVCFASFCTIPFLLLPSIKFLTRKYVHSQRENLISSRDN